MTIYWLSLLMGVAVAAFMGAAVGMFVGMWFGTASMISAVKHAFGESSPDPESQMRELVDRLRRKKKEATH